MLVSCGKKMLMNTTALARASPLSAEMMWCYFLPWEWIMEFLFLCYLSFPRPYCFPPASCLLFCSPSLVSLPCICVCVHIVLRIIISYQVKFINISCFITGQTIHVKRDGRRRLWRLHWVKMIKSFPSPLVLIYRFHLEINYRAGMINPDGIYMLWQAFVFNSND